MPQARLPAIPRSANPDYWKAVGKILEGMTDLLIAQYPDDKGIRVSVKVLEGAVNGLIEAMTEEEKKGA